MAAWWQSREALLERGVVTGLALRSEKKRKSFWASVLHKQPSPDPNRSPKAKMCASRVHKLIFRQQEK